MRTMIKLDKAVKDCTLGKYLFTICCLCLTITIKAQAEELNLKIGVISGLTGMATKWNYYQNKGIQLAAEELESPDTKIKLVFEDAKSLGSQGVSALHKLVDFDHVDAIIADDFGFVIKPLLPLAARRKILLVSVVQADDQRCTHANAYTYFVTSQVENSAAAFDSFFREHREIKKAAMFTFDDLQWGQIYHDIWKSLASKYGIEIVTEFISSEATPDFKPAIIKAVAQKADIMLLAHEPITFSKMLAATGSQGPILAANNFLEVLAGNDNLGPIFDRVYIADPIISPEFTSAFYQRFHEFPILEAYTGYEALKVIVKAFQANRTHPELGIRTVKYQGVGGQIDFTNNSCMGNKAVFDIFKLKERITPETSRQ